MPYRILVIEDNHDIARLVEMHLQDLSYQVDLAVDGRTGLDCAMKGRYDLIILDIMLPGIERIIELHGGKLTVSSTINNGF